MLGKAATAAIALVMGLTAATASKAQDIKLYAFSSGALTIGKGALREPGRRGAAIRCRSAST